MHVRNTSVGDQTASEQMDAMFRIAFNEDKANLEAIVEQEKQEQNQRGLQQPRQSIAAICVQQTKPNLQSSHNDCRPT